jgi:protein FAM32A
MEKSNKLKLKTKGSTQGLGISLIGMKSKSQKSEKEKAKLRALAKKVTEMKHEFDQEPAAAGRTSETTAPISSASVKPDDDKYMKKITLQQKTKAETRFIQRQEKIRDGRVSEKAQLSHREKVESFNNKLGELTEFHDIPKISWTK